MSSNSLHSQSWPWTPDPPASTSPVLGLPTFRGAQCIHAQQACGWLNWLVSRACRFGCTETLVMFLGALRDTARQPESREWGHPSLAMHTHTHTHRHTHTHTHTSTTSPSQVYIMSSQGTQQCCGILPRSSKPPAQHDSCVPEAKPV